ncbi:unnamed protein product [Notodromas monacha]|uniref:Uncharacterized protein n=1 Tax=Notodromas monacha TaxID=399045 RepID=A0A7R9BYJ9_9CRUS|nr:unnamed protein product [Notodromas monacha]CAG0923216.1 unnamed protein product [Notodromas monacha]
MKFRGAYDGPGTCITYESINHAFHEAKSRLGLPAPSKRDLSNKDVGQIARVVLETSRIISRQYSLPADAITNGLPLIDTTKTVIDQYCPYFLKFPACEPKRYRTYTGLCNNLEKPHWGSAQSAFKRLLPPAYADGLEIPRVSYSGRPLPSARVVSAHMHRDEGFHDHAVTVMLIAWGQAIDHDITLAVESKRSDGEDPRCCDRDTKHPDCFPIAIPAQDPFYSLFNKRCMSFVRNLPGAQYSCKLENLSEKML